MRHLKVSRPLFSSQHTRFSSSCVSRPPRQPRCAIPSGGQHFSTRVERNSLPSGGHTAHLSFTGEKKYPILNPPSISSLTNVLQTLAKEEKLRTLFLRSTIAGADITYMKDVVSPEQAETFIRSIDRLCSSIQHFPSPVIAVIDGPCFGAGMEVAASCDLRIAVRDPKTIFAMPETKIGIPSVVQASLLPGLIGWGRTRQLLYFGGDLHVDEALQWGFLNDIVTRERLPEALAKWEGLVDQAEPHAVAAQKALMRVWETEGTGRAGIEASIRMFGKSFETDIPRKIMGDYYAKLKARKR